MNAGSFAVRVSFGSLALVWLGLTNSKASRLAHAWVSVIAPKNRNKQTGHTLTNNGII